MASFPFSPSPLYATQKQTSQHFGRLALICSPKTKNKNILTAVRGNPKHNEKLGYLQGRAPAALHQTVISLTSYLDVNFLSAQF